MGSEIHSEPHLKREQGEKWISKTKKRATARLGKGRGLSFSLSGSKVDHCFYMVCLAWNSMSSPHPCIPTHDPITLPTPSILSGVPLRFCGISIPSFVRTGKPKEEFLHMVYSSWHPQAALHNAEAARVSPVYRTIKTYYTK